MADTTDWDQLEPDMNVEVKKYSREEYGKLSRAQKKGLKLKRMSKSSDTNTNNNASKHSGDNDEKTQPVFDVDSASAVGDERIASTDETRVHVDLTQCDDDDEEANTLDDGDQAIVTTFPPLLTRNPVSPALIEKEGFNFLLESRDNMDENVPANMYQESILGGFTTVTSGCCRRLQPGVFLNDSLIELFVHWTTRRETMSGPLFVVSSQFYNQLCDPTRDVTRWTSKRNVNIFDKKLVFVPINLRLHWSLVVIVNPGAVEDPGCAAKPENPFPVMLHFDSLQSHNTRQIGKDLRRWLNNEWNRLRHSSSHEKFTLEAMPIHFVPEAPRQPSGNDVDCGCYTCRNLLGMLQLKDHVFSFQEIGTSWARRNFVLQSGSFSYGQEYISRFRGYLLDMIRRFGVLYARSQLTPSAVAPADGIVIDEKESKQSGMDVSASRTNTTVTGTGLSADEARLKDSCMDLAASVSESMQTRNRPTVATDKNAVIRQGAVETTQISTVLTNREGRPIRYDATLPTVLRTNEVNGSSNNFDEEQASRPPDNDNDGSNKENCTTGSSPRENATRTDKHGVGEQSGAAPKRKISATDQNQFETIRRLRRRRNKEQNAREQIDTGAYPMHRKDAIDTGIAIPSSSKDTCLPDALATIISSIVTDEGRGHVQFPDGSIVQVSDIETLFRTALIQNGEWVKTRDMESFVSSIGFKASRVSGPDRRSKIAVLTRQQGHFLIICNLQQCQCEARHAIAYLAGKRWLIDNSPYQKVLHLEDSDIEGLTAVDENLTTKGNHLIHRDFANALFQRRLCGAKNEIIVWYEITRA